MTAQQQTKNSSFLGLDKRFGSTPSDCALGKSADQIRISTRFGASKPWKAADGRRRLSRQA
jgi:hypothetical protein